MATDEVPVGDSQPLEAPLRVPGAGLPVDNEPKKAFPTALVSPLSATYRWVSRGITLREQRMMTFISDISDKPEWERKVFDEAIVDKWRAEASGCPEELDGDVILSEAMFDFCIKELRDKAEIFKRTSLVNVFDGEITVVKSDWKIPETLRKSLSEGVKVLENVPDRLKDWHPRSDNMVLDLVHPSLFPVSYGLTKYLPDEKVPLDGCLGLIGKGTTIESFKPSRTSTRRPYEWGSFQWLPTDIKLTDTGAKLQGYINNLHPERHRVLYGVLEDVVGATIPVWQEALSGFHDRRRITLNETGAEDWTYPEGLLYRIPDREDGPDAWYDPVSERVCAEDGTPYEDGQKSRYDDFTCENEWYDWQHAHRILKHREPREYAPQSGLADPKKRVDFRASYPEGLQVIFKLANIHLTPEKPEYKGGSWHVEGGFNEMICASAIYYYDQENVGDSHLAFRQAMDTEYIMCIAEQSEYESLEAYLGVEQDGPAMQDLGSVLTREGRLLAFPNCLQHQVQPFSLADKTKPGHRKILAMFLVEPRRRLLSTSNVPPQRRDWWAEELRGRDLLNEMPPELREHAIEMVDDFPISWEKAVGIREKLMDERSDGNEIITDDIMENRFFFCEH